MNTNRVTTSQHQKGVALIISLILLTVITLISISSISSSIHEERIAASQKQINDAFMAAETGVSAAVKTFYDENEGFVWVWDETLEEYVFQEQDTIDRIMNQQAFVSIRPGLEWQIESIQHNSVVAGVEKLTIRSLGRLSGLGVFRKIEFDILIPHALFVDPPAPLTLAGQVDHFGVGDSEHFKIAGENTPAIVVDNDTEFPGSLETVINAIPESHIDNYIGESGETTNDIHDAVKAQNLGFWSNPNALRNFVEVAKLFGTTYSGATVFAAGDPNVPSDNFNIGQYTDNTNNEFVISVVDGDATISGDRSGAGILIVAGELTWTGTPEFSGLVVVLGGRVNWSAGGDKGINGAMYIANIDLDQIDNNNSSFFEEIAVTKKVGFSNDGSSILQFDRDLLNQVAGSESPRIVNWREVK